MQDKLHLKGLVVALSLICIAPANAQVFEFLTDTFSDPLNRIRSQQTDSSVKFQFVVIGDLTGGYRHGIFPVAVQKANSIAPDFVMSVGDLIEGYTEDTAQIFDWWNQFDKWIDQLTVPFFYVPGNHDLSNSVMTDIWQTRYGKTYYHFVYQNVLFMVLNTEDGAPSRISPDQVKYFEDVLRNNEDVVWTLLFFHKPLWAEEELGFSEIEELLNGRKYTVFAGHTHRYLKEVRKGMNYYTLSTTGGGNPLSGPEYGLIDHFAWVTMKENGPQVANLALDGILPDDILSTASLSRADCMLASKRMDYTPMLETEPTNQWTTDLKFNNVCPEPLNLSVRFFAHPVLSPSLVSIDTTLLPDSSLEIPLHIFSKSLLLGSQQIPLVLEWTVESFDGVYRQNGEKPLYVFKANEVENVPENLIIDGVADEWGDAVFRTPREFGYYKWTWNGVNDCAIDTRVAADSTSLYCMLRVQDEDLFYSPYRNSWEQDGAHLFIELPGGEIMKVGFSLTDSLFVDVQKNWPIGAIVKASTTDTGYTAELKIPLTAMNEMHGSPVRHLRIQWVVFDHDFNEDQYKGTKCLDMLNAPGSGTYFLPQFSQD